MSSSGGGFGIGVGTHCGMPIDTMPKIKVGKYSENGAGFKAEIQAGKLDVGPAKAKIGLGVSTGIDTKDGFKAEMLGTGGSVNSEGVKVKVLGSSVGIKYPWKWFD
ncbi:hypothetical protein WR25_23690 [Diploscapter pachys]|uniref:Uncharacterized protein n=1 Tax=Diploscapter pachys TaxID=2018661 RepID=A0A2A2JZN4_9BILA|nr:hypothetical protein WR25_23690 [Diploscapter pachys]